MPAYFQCGCEHPGADVWRASSVLHRGGEYADEDCPDCADVDFYGCDEEREEECDGDYRAARDAAAFACPTCGWPNKLTPADRAQGYQCDSCANARERGMDIDYYEGDER